MPAEDAAIIAAEEKTNFDFIFPFSETSPNYVKTFLATPKPILARAKRHEAYPPTAENRRKGVQAALPRKKKRGEKRAGLGKPTKKTRETFPAFLRAQKGAQIPKTGAGAIFCGATKPPPRPEHRQKMPQQRARGRSKARGHYPSMPLANRFRRSPESLSRRRRSPALRPPRK